MYFNVAATIPVLIYLMVSTTAHPSCDIKYGRPIASHCALLMRDFFAEMPDAPHVFSLAAVPRPAYVSQLESYYRIMIPLFMPPGRYFRTPL